VNATETAKLLRRLGACEEARNWVQGHTLAWAWEKCERAYWLEWLANALGVRMTDSARAEYDRVEAAAWAKYNRGRAAAQAEYDRVRAPAYRAAVPYAEILKAAKERA